MSLLAPSIWFVVAVLIGLGLSLLLARRAGFGLRQAIAGVAVFSIGATAGAWVGARLQGSHLLAEAGPISLLMGSLFLFVAAPRLRLQGSRFVDVILPAVLFGFGFAHVGCVFTDSLVGGFTILPFGMRFPRGSMTWHLNVLQGLVSRNAEWSVPTHPLSLYVAAVEMAVGVALLGARRVPQTLLWQGERLLLTVAVLGATATSVSFLRDSSPASSQPYLGETGLAVTVISLAILLGRRWVAASTQGSLGSVQRDLRPGR